MKKKVLISIYIVLCSIFIGTNVSFAYLDPSAMTYVIQIGAAIGIAISTSIGILFYKLKRKLKRKKENDIDEEE